MQSPGTPATTQTNFVILLIEDDPATRFIMSQILHRDGYTIVEAPSGEDGLHLYNQLLPDLVLLDAMLPGIDGFETCQKIQLLPKAMITPVLMVTTLEDTASVNRAFEVGATDYVTKPIHWPVLRQRVRYLLQSRQHERMREDLTNMIVHDMKAPLVAINGYMELLLDNTWGELNLQQQKAIQRTYQNTQRLLDLSTMILDMARMEEGKFNLEISNVSLAGLLQKAVDNLDWMAQNSGITLKIAANQTIYGRFDENLMQRVLTNLISNAIKHSPRGSEVILNATQENGKLQVSVRDSGEGIDEEDQAFIFDKYRQAVRRKGGSRIDTGLGLTFCKLAVETMGGKIEVESSLGKGSTFSMIFPTGDNA